MFPAFGRSIEETRKIIASKNAYEASLPQELRKSPQVIASGYNRAPLAPEGKILTVKEWKRKMEYDLLVKESYKNENIKRASDTLSSGNHSSARGSSLLSSGLVS